MTGLIRIILDKPEWATKIKDESITNTWKQEAADQGISPNVFRCVLQLLQDYKEKKDTSYEDDADYDWDVKLGVDLNHDLGFTCDCTCAKCEDGYNTDESGYSDDDDDYKKKRTMPCLCTDELRIARFEEFLNKFVFTRSLEDPTLKDTLIQQIAQLERTCTEIDYHPGSNNQVIDLVHPSLFCYVKDVTQVRSDLAQPIPVSDAVFKWLPTEFSVQRNEDNTVQSVSIDSYINNLPRAQNEGLYQSIASVFGHLVPQFDQALQALHDSSRLTSPSAPATLAHCQVIVKLANIVVAPGEVFPGGHWHLEGMRTERIVATGIYYYEMSNVQDNQLQFRSTIADVYDIPYPQNGMSSVHHHFGMVEKVGEDSNYDREMESTIDLGEVATKEDLLLVFPNFLQHKVSEVQLQDATQPGTRKILCFFLVNPYEQVLSTAHVAPQQPSSEAGVTTSGAESGVMSLEDAKLYRELLMFQRKYEIDDQTNFFERGWSLCEH
eukprot:gene12464-14423_t